jgi:hypothetical protein
MSIPGLSRTFIRRVTDFVGCCFLDLKKEALACTSEVVRHTLKPIESLVQV